MSFLALLGLLREQTAVSWLYILFYCFFFQKFGSLNACKIEQKAVPFIQGQYRQFSSLRPQQSHRPWRGQGYHQDPFGDAFFYQLQAMQDQSHHTKTPLLLGVLASLSQRGVLQIGCKLSACLALLSALIHYAGTASQVLLICPQSRHPIGW